MGRRLKLNIQVDLVQNKRFTNAKVAPHGLEDVVITTLDDLMLRLRKEDMIFNRKLDSNNISQPLYRECLKLRHCAVTHAAQRRHIYRRGKMSKHA